MSSILRQCLLSSPSRSVSVLTTFLKHCHVNYHKEMAPRFLSFSRNCLERFSSSSTSNTMTCRYTVAVYACLCWVLFHSKVEDFAFNGENKQTRDIFMRVLVDQFIFFSSGLRSNGEPHSLPNGRNLYLERQLDVFVIRLISIFAHL